MSRDRDDCKREDSSNNNNPSPTNSTGTKEGRHIYHTLCGIHHFPYSVARQDQEFVHAWCHKEPARFVVCSSNHVAEGGSVVSQPISRYNNRAACYVHAHRRLIDKKKCQCLYDSRYCRQYVFMLSNKTQNKTKKRTSIE